MRLNPALATAIVLFATAAQAATVPLANVYGSPSGCAARAETADPGGEKVLLSSDDVRFEGNVCPYTKITASGDKAWQVEIACESGHDEVVRGSSTSPRAPTPASSASHSRMAAAPTATSRRATPRHPSRSPRRMGHLRILR